MESDKSTYTGIWDDINKFIFPNSESFYSEYKGGQKRRRVLFDGTAERALEIFSASMIGLIANPSAKYINFEPRDKKLLEIKEVQVFLEEAQDYVLGVFNDPQTKFYDNLFYCMQYLGAYGTTALLSDPDKEHVAVFRAESPKHINFTENFNGKVEEIFLERKYTTEQLRELQEKEGWEIPKEVFRKKEDDECTVIRHIYPNPDFKEDGIGTKFARYRSDYWLKEEKVKAKTSGFSTFPAPLGRWGKLDQEKWGDSPGRVALTDVKILNASERHMTFAEEYSLRPSLFVSSEAKFGKLNLSAGAINVGRGNPNDSIRQLNINGDLSYSLERNRLRREVVMQAFYVDIFQTLSDVDMTATEAQIRQQERLRGLAPKTSRVQTDLIGPTSERVLRMGIDRGDLKPPDAIRGTSLEVTYTSPMANAQRAQDAVNLQLFLQDMAVVGQFNQQALLRVDYDAITEEFAEIRGVPAKALLEKKEYEELLKQIQQQQQLQQGLETAKQAGEAGQAISAATNNEQTG